MVVAHVALPESQLASIEIVNIFEPGDGDTLRFTETSFEVGDCLVNGEKTNLAAYKIPSKVWFRTEPIPRNASGKFLKREVRKEILEGA